MNGKMWTIVGCTMLAAGSWVSGMIAGAAMNQSDCMKIIATSALKKTCDDSEKEEKTEETEGQEEA